MQAACGTALRAGQPAVFNLPRLPQVALSSSRGTHHFFASQTFVFKNASFGLDKLPVRGLKCMLQHSDSLGECSQSQRVLTRTPES